MESNNIILFPKQNNNINTNAVSLEEVNRNVEMLQMYHIQETIASLAPIIFNKLEVAGFSLAEDEDENIKEGAFIVESLRSLMCKHYKLYHPFQQVATNIFTQDDEDKTFLKIVDSICIELKKPVPETEVENEE